MREGLDAHAQLQRDLTVLRAKAKKEKQINRRVELNLEIKRLEAELADDRENTLKESNMKPLTAQDPETKSPDLVAENIERLKALFPKPSPRARSTSRCSSSCSAGPWTSGRRSTG